MQVYDNIFNYDSNTVINIRYIVKQITANKV